jgi:NAD+ synthase (glutamine-hydrolysing)
VNTELKVAACQMEVIPGRPDLNVANMLSFIEEAKTNGNELICFPEMAVSGYLLGDEWENEAFISDVFSYNNDIIAASEGIAVVWGNVDVDISKKAEDGRTRKYNAALLHRTQNCLAQSIKH